MIKKTITSLLALVTICALQAQRPKLVVGIVIDQMKQEYLYRFDEKFGEDGFKRIQKEGFSCKNAHYNYIPTNTAPGHASIYTGSTPRYHGIISNSWYSKALGRGVYCVGDTNAISVGGSALAGKRSPVNLKTTTITDELKLTTNFRSKVIGISLKDRGSVLPAGHHPDGAYWYDGATGNFITSNYYMDTLPKWVSDFNSKKLVSKYSEGSWQTLLPISEYSESTVDNSPYEVGFRGKETPTFPYNLSELRKKNGPYDLISNTPFANELVMDFAKSALENEKLGIDNITDFLAVSFSSPDYIGHNFAPNSIEVEDTYIRMDLLIANFLKYLDQKIGKDEYLVFVTADHGAVANPQFLVDNGMPGGYSSRNAIKNNLQTYLTELYGEGNWVLDVSNSQIFLNQALIAEKKLRSDLVNLTVVQHLNNYEDIAESYTLEQIRSATSNDRLGILLQNGHNRQLSGNVAFVFKSGFLEREDGAKGTSHGSGYIYDTHIPILFYGKGIEAGCTVEAINITDIAPTLAMLLNISLPSGCTGQPIKDLFK